MKTDPDILPLIILDVQDAIDQPVWAGKNNPDYLSAIIDLLAHWRARGWPVIHIKHDEAAPASTYHYNGPWNGIKKEVLPLPGEPLIIKEQNCGFIKTDLDVALKKLGAKQFVLTGVVVHNSMDATIRAGKALGYKILLPSDATTAVPVTGADGRVFDAQTVYELSLAILGGEYADIVTSADVMATDPS